MHSRHIGQLIRPPSACHHTNWSTVKAATCLLSLNTEPTGQSRLGTWISSLPAETIKNKSPSWKNSEKKHTIVPSYTRKEPKDGTIAESSTKNSKAVTKSCSSTRESSFSGKKNFAVNGKDRTPSLTLHHMAQ